MKIAQKLSQNSGVTPIAINAANKHYASSGATSVALSPSATSQQQQLHDNMAGSPPRTATSSLSSSSAATQRDTNLNHYKQAAASAGVLRSSSSNIAHQPLSPIHKQSSGSQELLSSSSGCNSPNADGMKKISNSSSSNAVFQESKPNLRQSRSASLDDDHEQRRSSVGGNRIKYIFVTHSNSTQIFRSSSSMPKAKINCVKKSRVRSGAVCMRAVCHPTRLRCLAPARVLAITMVMQHCQILVRIASVHLMARQWRCLRRRLSPPQLCRPIIPITN